MHKIIEYVQLRDGAWYVAGSGVQVYAVIAMWQQGFAPEEILHSFPALSLQAIYGTILHYLEHREALDVSFRDQDSLFAQKKAVAEARDPAFYSEIRERITKLHAVQVPETSATIQ